MISFTAGYLVRLAACGGAAAFVSGLFMWMSWLALEKASARSSVFLRHRIACIHLAAVPLLTGITIASVHLAFLAMGRQIYRGPPPPELAYSFGTPAAGTACLLLVGAWVAGSALIAIRLGASGWLLANVGRSPASAELAEAVGTLCRQTLPSRKVAVRVGDVPGPQVAGVGRPLLTLPHDFAARFPADERDAVLLHELAHVRRRDFGWNLAQALIVSIFWFQPAVWALHRAISRERESCCDSLAVEHGASPAALGRALLRLAEHRKWSTIGMAASGGGDLVARVQRLAGSQAPVAQWGWTGSVAATGALFIAVLGIGGFAFRDPAMNDLYVASTFGPTVLVNGRDAGGSFGLHIRHGQVVQASVGDFRLPSRLIAQRGSHLTLYNQSLTPVIAIDVGAQGRIRWKARDAR